MIRRSFVCVFVAFAPALALASPLVVHEWGTFTSIAGADGHAAQFRPLLAPSDLPPFVHTLAVPAPGVQRMPLEKRNLWGTVRMETPVVYLYAERPIDATVRVDFPSGQIIEWYPAARSVTTGIDWGSVRILPQTVVALPTAPGPSHYYRAREVDAPILQKGEERERFLFYRGVGSFQPPLTATLADGLVHLDSASALGEAIVFERKGDRSGYRVVHAGQGANTVVRPELLPDRGHRDLLRDLEALLVRRGLYEKEARAMVATWGDTWFEEGLRIFYVVPDDFTDAVLPLTIAPAPKERVRVLVGRMELVAPERLDAIAGELRAIGRASGGARAKLLADLREREGRFAEPILARLAEAADPEMREAISALLPGR